MPTRPGLSIIKTELGTFFEVNRVEPMIDSWTFECPACRVHQYMDIDQWEGRVSVLCECGNYHETHDYKRALLKGMRGIQSC